MPLARPTVSHTAPVCCSVIVVRRAFCDLGHVDRVRTAKIGFRDDAKGCTDRAHAVHRVPETAMTVAPEAAAPLPSLRRNFGYAFIGRLAYALTQFGILAVLVRLGTPEDVGAFTLASAIVTPVFFLTSMGMREVHTVDDLDRFTRTDYVALRILAGAIAILLTLGLLALFYADDGAAFWGAVIAFSFVKFFAAQMSLNHGMFQREERQDFVALSNIARGGFGLVVFALAFWSTRSLPVALACEAASLALSYLLVDRRMLARIGAVTHLSDLKGVRLAKILRLGWWMLPVGVSLWFLRASASAPPIVLERHADLATVGVFGALAYIHTALAMVSNTLGSVAAPRLRKAYRKGKRGAVLSLTLRLSILAAGLGLLCVAGAWFVGDEVLRLVFGEAYRRGDLLTVILLASTFMIMGGPVVAAINAGHAFRRRVFITGAGFTVAVAASVLLIPAFGLFGAAWSLVAMTATNLCLNLLVFGWVLRRIPARVAADDTPEGGS